MGSSRVVSLIKEKGYRCSDEPFLLASGAMSRDYIDVKAAIASGDDLRFVAEQMALIGRSIGITAVGGMSMGADPLAHAIAVIMGWDWFSVRKEPKGRGTGRTIEGAVLGPRSRVFLVDDVVTTGMSILMAYSRVQKTGADIRAASAVVDRGDAMRQEFRERGVPYKALVTYEDLGIERVG